MAFQDFVSEYFVNPILYPDKYAPYNVYNTLVYAALALVAAYVIYWFLKKIRVEIDQDFFKAVIPFVVFGSFLRVVTDAGALPRVVKIAGLEFFPFVTPGIYILTFLIVISTLLATKAVYKEKFKPVAGKIGWLLAALAFIPLIPLLKLNALVLLVPILAGAGVLCLLAVDKIRGMHSNAIEKATVFAQSLDGAATFVGVQFAGYSEQHVLGNAIFDSFGGPWAFLLIKIAFGILVVQSLRGEKEDQKNFVLLLITIFGIGPGIRDALRMWLGV